MYTNVNGPPILEYEQVITPIQVTTRSASLDRKDAHDGRRDKRKRRRRQERNLNEADIMYEPFVGHLFDFTA